MTSKATRSHKSVWVFSPISGCDRGTLILQVRRPFDDFLSYIIIFILILRLLDLLTLTRPTRRSEIGVATTRARTSERSTKGPGRPGSELAPSSEGTWSLPSYIKIIKEFSIISIRGNLFEACQTKTTDPKVPRHQYPDTTPPRWAWHMLTFIGGG